VEVAKQLNLPEMDLESYSTQSCNSMTATGIDPKSNTNRTKI